MNAATLSAFSGNDVDIDAVRDAFWRDGVVIIHDLFTRAQMAAATRVLEGLVARIAEQPLGGGDTYGERFETRTQAFGRLTDPPLVAIFETPIVQRLTEAIVGPGYTETPIGAWATGPGCGQAWHQDSGSRDPSQYNLNRIIFTRDVAPGQGDLLVVPGSHRDRDLPPGDLYEPIPGQVAVTPRENTFVLLHTRCFHCVTRNQTAGTRIQANRRVCPAGVDGNICSQARFRTGTWDFNTGAPWE